MFCAMWFICSGFVGGAAGLVVFISLQKEEIVCSCYLLQKIFQISLNYLRSNETNMMFHSLNEYVMV
jgi:hypothetical protein